MATNQTIVGETIKYDIGDSVAFMPLIVGLRRVGKYDLGLFEPLCRYQPPNADILRQSWKLRNSKLYGAVHAACKKCNTGPLFALHAKTKGKTVTEHINLHSVFYRAKKIEMAIKTFLDGTLNEATEANVTFMRQAAVQELGSKLDMFDDGFACNVAFDFLKKNSIENEKHLKSVFGFTGVNVDAWAGLNTFKKFFLANIAGTPDRTKYKAAIIGQEKLLINSFTSIITHYHAVYDGFISQLSADIDTKISSAYFTGENVCGDGRKEQKIQDIREIIDKYLWNAIFERLEILDSIVNTFFSVCCMSKSVHIPLARKFMDNAAIYCLEPLFSAVKSPPVKHSTGTHGEKADEQKIKRDNEKADIHSFFTAHVVQFDASRKKMFEASGLKTKIVAFTANDKYSIKMNMSPNVMVASNGKGQPRVLVGPKARDDTKTEMFNGLETYITNLFKNVPDIILETLIDNKSKSIDDLMHVHRSPGIRLDIIRALNVILKAGANYAKFKDIVYSNLYFDSVSYAMYHFNSFDESTMVQDSYFKNTSHPFSISMRVKTEDLKGEAYTGKVTAISRAAPARMNTATLKLPDLAAPTAKIMVLGKEFVPLNSKPTTQEKSNPGKSAKGRKRGGKGKNAGKGGNNAPQKTIKKNTKGPKGGKSKAKPAKASGKK